MSERIVQEYYNTNKDIKAYIDKYARDREITPEVAFTHQIVKAVTEFKTSTP